MFSIGMPELILILVVALIVLGPKRLPEIARALGKGLAELRRASDELKDEFKQMEEETQASITDEDSSSLAESASPPPSTEEREKKSG